MKIFGIGQHRTGTTTLAQLFKDIGLNSKDMEGDFFAISNKYNFEKEILDKYDCFFDGFENIHNYSNKKNFNKIPKDELIFPDLEKLVKTYPNAKFIYHHKNLRSFLISKINRYDAYLIHWNNRKFTNEMCEFFYNTYINYEKYVLDFFKNKKEKLLIINLCDDSNEYNLNKLNKFFPDLNIKEICKLNVTNNSNNELLKNNIKIIDNFLKIKNIDIYRKNLKYFEEI